MIRLLGLIGTLTAALFIASVQAAAPPDQVVRNATEKLSAEIRARQDEFKAKPKTFYAVVERITLPHFDQRQIAQLVLGRSWKDASEPQRKRFTEAFKNQLIRTYADALLQYNDQVRIDWQPLRLDAEATDAMVKSRLMRKDAPPVAIGFALRLKDDSWKIYDITVENISLISSFRGQANSEIKNSGIDGFIAKLETGKFLKKSKSQDDE